MKNSIRVQKSNGKLMRTRVDGNRFLTRITYRTRPDGKKSIVNPAASLKNKCSVFFFFFNLARKQFTPPNGPHDNDNNNIPYLSYARCDELREKNIILSIGLNRFSIDTCTEKKKFIENKIEMTFIV